MFAISANDISQWAAIAAEVGGALAGVAIFVAGFTVLFEYRSGRRDAIRLRQEQWRVSYRNLNITHSTVLTHPATAPAIAPATAPATTAVVPTQSASSPIGRKVSPDLMPPGERKTPLAPQPQDSQFLIFQLDVENIGDGPVDIWACLVAARELNAGDHKESWGGNIEWNDLDPYYFDTETPEWEHLAGISNTRHIVYSQGDYILLDPKEHDTLTRIDRIDPVKRHVTLLYRTFLVGHGYGGEFRQERPRDMVAWQRLQQSLFNVSGPSFRILFNERDPLDQVADIDGFPCFLLYHRAFTDDHRDHIGWTKVDWLNTRLEGDWGKNHDYPDALKLVEDNLAPYKAQWQRNWSAFQQAAARCRELERGFADLIKSDWKPQVPGAAAGEYDLSTLTAKQAFDRLPDYLRWNPDDDDSLPFWEKFFIVPLPPGEELREPAPVAMPSYEDGFGR